MSPSAGREDDRPISGRPLGRDAPGVTGAAATALLGTACLPPCPVPQGDEQRDSCTGSPGSSGVSRQMIKKDESDEHATTNKMAQTRWRMSKTVVLEAAGSSSSQRGGIAPEGTSYVSKLRDTPKDHSFTSEVTGKDLKLEEMLILSLL